MNTYKSLFQILFLTCCYLFGGGYALQAQTASIMGRVIDDSNANCSLDFNETGLGQVVVTARGAQNTYHTLADTNGFYRFILLPPDTYAISAALAYDTLYWRACANAFPTVTVQNGQVDTAHLLFFRAANSPLIRAELSNSRLEPCKTAILGLAMQNVGTDTTAQYSATLILDPQLSYAGSVVSSSGVNVSVLAADTLRFSFAGGQRHELQKPVLYNVWVNVNCDAAPDYLVYCKLFVDNDSLVIRPAWNDAIIKTSHQCDIDSIRFELKNIGNTNQNPIEYYIVEDNVMLRQGTVNLQNNQTAIVSIPNTQSYTYRLEAKNPFGIPAVLGDSFTYSMSEGCDTVRELSSFMGWFPTNDVSPFVDYCATEIVSNNPDFYLETSPEGYDTAHYVSQGSWIEYTVHFRNTQGNTVTEIDLIDTLPDELDMSTLQMGASSHDVSLNLNNHILNAHIFNANLQDSSSNYLQSIGFISYRARLKDNLPNGTTVRNRAHILYDINFAYYHLPEVFHTVGHNFIRVLSVFKNVLTSQKVIVYPNPFKYQTIFEIANKAADLRLYVFNGLGQLVKTVEAKGSNQLILQRDQLSAGVYYYQFVADDMFLDAGKVIVE